TGVARPQRQALDRLARALARYSCWRLRGQPSGAADDDADRPGLFADAPADADADRLDRADDGPARVILDWPPNRPLDVRRPAVRAAIQRMASTAIEVYFVERFVHLARPGCMVAMIVPERILAS